MAINQLRLNRIISIAKSYGATRLILFGSAADNLEEARDIDIACDGVPGWKIFELAARLEDELGTLLDIVPLDPPNSFTRDIEIKGKVLV